MSVQSCLYDLERSTDNRPISMIRTLQGHTTQSRAGQRVHQAIDFSKLHFKDKAAHPILVFEAHERRPGLHAN